MPDGVLIVPHDASVADAALAGLCAEPKTLPSKLFYDAAGCALFDRITELPEYYVTRTELALLRAIAPELGRLLPPDATLVEYGAGSEVKAAILLAAMASPRAYVPLDVAGGAIDAAAARLRVTMPGLEVTPIQADFMAPLSLPGAPAPVGFFPGSTIGNLEPAVAVRFLREARRTLGAGALFVVGADLRKSEAVLIPAYDDAAGVTAAFNRNILAHLNREAGADFVPNNFAHSARWNAAEGRIEMHLASRGAQTVTVAGHRIHFANNETIHTENSYKHTIPGLQALAAEAGWTPAQVWTDPEDLFAIHLWRAN